MIPGDRGGWWLDGRSVAVIEIYCDHGVVAMASVKTGAGREGAARCDGGLARGSPGGGVLTRDAETRDAGLYPHLCDHWVSQRGSLVLGAGWRAERGTK